MTALMIGLAGPKLTAQDIKNLQHPLVCGVIFFKRNFVDYKQLTQLITATKAIKGEDCLFAVDQEGGRVIRFGLPFTQLEPLTTIGDAFDNNPDNGKTYAHLHAWLMASELLSIGIDLSFAPVLDIDNGSNVIGDRAFSSNPDTVSTLGEIYCNSMQAAGMKTTGKHYPGHGTVVADSHIDLPIDDRMWDELEKLDLKPFIQLIDAGCVDAMMLSHVIYNKSCDLPAGYSNVWNEILLRKKHGFKGISISDDLGMKAAECVGPVEKRYQACVDADIDMTLVCDFDLCTELLSNNRLKYLPISTQKLSKIRRLKGQSTLDTSRPFWEQSRWQHARKALIHLRNS